MFKDFHQLRDYLILKAQSHIFKLPVSTHLEKSLNTLHILVSIISMLTQISIICYKLRRNQLSVCIFIWLVPSFLPIDLQD